MSFLLPHQFKKIGIAIAPLGFFIWLSMQMGYISKLLTNFLGKSDDTTISIIHKINVSVAIISFWAFLGGMYFLSFSKEKIEDEMIEKVRLQSFQFAALLQLMVIILSFALMFILGDLSEGILMLFFISLIFSFWLSFVFRFNYILHIKRTYEK